MALLRIVARLPWDSGLPEDVTVNVWHVDATGGDPQAAIITFYESIDEHLSNIVQAGSNQCSLTTYALDDPEPRQPVAEHFFSLPGASGTPMAPEVALCLSFSANLVSGSPPARRRGRVYLGPLDSGVIDTSGRPATSVTDSIAAAGQALLDASDASLVWSWVVYSPTDDLGRIVTHGWVDNEFDTQRSRGRIATARSSFTS